MLQVMMIGRVLVRADNLVQGSDQQGCSPSATPTMITGQVPTVHVPPDHANGRVAVAVPARGGGEDHRDPDPAPSARRPAAEAPPPETELGGCALTATLLRALPKAQRQRCGCLSPRTRSCADICAWCCRSTPPTTTADGPTARLTFRHPTTTST